MKDKIKEVLENIRPEFDFADSDNFLEDGLLDSFDLITLVGFTIDGLKNYIFIRNISN